MYPYPLKTIKMTFCINVLLSFSIIKTAVPDIFGHLGIVEIRRDDHNIDTLCTFKLVLQTS